MHQVRLEAVDGGVFAAGCKALVLLEIGQRWHHLLNSICLEHDFSILIFEFSLTRDAETVLAGEHNLSLLDVQLGLYTLKHASVLLDLRKEKPQ